MLERWSVALNRESAQTVLSGVGGQLVVIVSGVLVARMLGVANRGEFALIALLPLILSQVGTLGLPVATTYYIALGASPRRMVAVVKTHAIVHTLVLIVLHAALAWLLFRHRSTEVKLSALLSLLVTPAAVAQVWGLAVLQGSHRFGSFNILRLVGPATYSAGLVLLFIAHHHAIIAATIAWLVGSAVGSAATLIVARGVHPRAGAVEVPAPSVSALYTFGLKGLLGSVYPIETFQLDQFYIGVVFSPAALGLYVVGGAVTNLTRFFLPQSIGMVAYPKVAAARSLELARRTVWQFVVVALVLCGAVVGALELIVGWIIPTVFGTRFAPAVPVARILLLGSLFLAGRRVLAEATRGAGLPGLGALSELAALAVAVPALLVTAGSGLQSVTWALTTAYGVSLTFMIAVSAWSLRSRRQVSRWRAQAAEP